MNTSNSFCETYIGNKIGDNGSFENFKGQTLKNVNEYCNIFQEQIKYVKNFAKQDVNVKKSIQLYTDNDFYKILNETMRQNKPLTGDYKMVYDTFKVVFSNIIPLKRNITLYRSIDSDVFDINMLEKQFVSTTTISNFDTYPHIRYMNRCCFFEIEIPIGTKCIPMIEYSNDPSECEILLDQGLEWILDKKYSSTTKDIYYIHIKSKQPQKIPIGKDMLNNLLLNEHELGTTDIDEPEYLPIYSTNTRHTYKM